MIKRKVLSTVCSIVMGSSFMVHSLAMAAVPAPVLHDDNPISNFGDWYVGAVSSQASINKPVILFVQGLHSNYSTWTGVDSYYEAAYNAGYRTAFVQLKDSDGSGGDMYTNGKVLADVIRKVAAYYNVPKINIIAHSKGGIDTQTALVYYGASQYVNVVHQLSTPNKGSELADMAYSNWASWLADILGKKDDAVYSLQTSYMANYRSQTDGKSENKITKTYMSGGMGDDGIFTSYWFAHAILPGEDDGAVSLYSALGLPDGITNFTKNISHSAMTKASKTWNLVQPKLELGYGVTSAVATMTSGMPETQINSLMKLKKESLYSNKEDVKVSGEINENLKENNDLILRGGEFNNSESVLIPLESGISSITLEVMTAKSSTDIALVSPSGYTYNFKPATTDSDPFGIFSKAIRRRLQVDKPQAGNWTVKLKGNEDAYFIITNVNTKNKTMVTTDKKVLGKGEASKLSVDVSKNFKGIVKHSKVPKSMHNIETTPEPQYLMESSAEGKLNISFVAPTNPGVYNLSFDVEGINDKGEKVVRSINYNFSVTDYKGNIK